jgi:hypothetical protein
MLLFSSLNLVHHPTYRNMNQHRFQFLLLILTKLDHMERDAALNTRLNALEAAHPGGPAVPVADFSKRTADQVRSLVHASFVAIFFALVLFLHLLVGVHLRWIAGGSTRHQMNFLAAGQYVSTL